MWHDPGSAAAFIPAGDFIQPDTHAENAETKRRLRNLLEVSGLLDTLVPIAPRYAQTEELLRFHGREYVESVQRLSAGRGGDAGVLTPYGPGSYDIARLSAGGVIAAVDAVVQGRVRNAYALVRPPGHHAEPDQGMGFCIFGNIAIAVMHAQAHHRVGRVAVVDWDVHHGNGTERAFWFDPTVLTLSIHQDNYFPAGRGHVSDIGEGEGEGFNINIPLPPGSGAGAYEAVFDELVLPALHAFRPELIVVASGFDAGGMDPLGRMLLHSECFRSMTRKVMQAADALCGGRLVLSHEGGYSTASVPFHGLAVLEQLSGHRTQVVDPFLDLLKGFGGQRLQRHQHAAIQQVRPLVARLGAG